MDLNFILKTNREYDDWKKDIDKQIKDRKSNIEYFNKRITSEEFKALGYIKAKELFNEIRNNLDFQNHRKQLEKALIELKEEEYPILKKAHYYPIINEMDFLNDSQKNALDEVLKIFSHGYIITHSTAWYDLKFNQELTNKIMEFLYEKGIIRKTYKLSCGCTSGECDEEILTEERYNKFIAYHSVIQEEINKMSESELKEYNDNWEDGYIEVGCWNGNDYEVCNIEDLERHIQPNYYFNCTQPDLTYDNL